MLVLPQIICPERLRATLEKICEPEETARLEVPLMGSSVRGPVVQNQLSGHQGDYTLCPLVKISGNYLPGKYPKYPPSKTIVFFSKLRPSGQ
jgi:hypothetical protein